MAKPKNKAPTPAADAGPQLSTLLAAAVQATQTNQPMFSTEAIMSGLLKHPAGQLVEFNENMKDPAGNIAFRATQLGIQVNAAGTVSGQSQQPAAAQGQSWASAPPPTLPPGAPNTGAPVNPGAIVNGLSRAAPTPMQPGQSLTFENGIPIPPRRGGRSANDFGFEQMQVGQSFFVAKTDDNPNPGKRVASTVSSASKRLAPMEFIVRSVEGGARVWRTA